MKKIILFLLIVLGTISNTYSQIKKLMPITADCKNAIKLDFGKNKNVVYGPTISPIGFGQIQEIRGSEKKSCTSFEKEHNSSWYYFDAPSDGNLVLDIISIDTTNDYDFMIFKVKGLDGSFCDLINRQPVRSNISRSGKGEVSITGLSSVGKANLVHSGPGETFSKPLEVKKGERYYLVLDNVYSGGLGHTIKLGYQKTIQIGGVVFNDEDKPIQVDVTISDSQGHQVTTQSDSLGKYLINANLWESFSYSISFFNSSYFVNNKTIINDSLIKNDYKLNNIKTILPKLKDGKKYTLGGINFYGDEARLLPESYPSVSALCKLMKRNKKIKIRIEGHINDPGNPSLDSHKEMSEARARVIYKMLLYGGIEKERMTTIGFGSKYMLFPRAHSLEEQEANRRVEINVLSGQQ